MLAKNHFKINHITQILSGFDTMAPVSIDKKIESLCRKAIHEHDLLDGVSRVGIALSGGKDSLTLLHMLKRLSGCGFEPFEVVAFHVHGAFSCGPSVTKDFLSQVCDELNVKLHVLESRQSLDQLECYSCSRMRRKLIFDAAKEAGVDLVAFGHHRDDSVQTLLMNALHKGEFAANLPKVPMVHYGVTIIRPLIYVSEEAIRCFAKQEGFARITCQCPVGQRSRRKKVDELLDHMEEIFPNARAHLAKLGREHGLDKAMHP